MSNFVAAYQKMDIDAYRQTLHDTFIFRYQAFDVEALNLPSDHHNRDEELKITENMFSRHPVTHPDGTTVPGIAGISFDVIDPLTTWDLEYSGDFEGSYGCLFYVRLNIKRPEDNAIVVEGESLFYATARDTLVNDSPVRYWTLTGQIDRTNTSKDADANSSLVNNQVHAWGGVKAQF
jgi:hypothetical protein